MIGGNQDSILTKTTGSKKQIDKMTTNRTNRYESDLEEGSADIMTEEIVIPWLYL